MVAYYLAQNINIPYTRVPKSFPTLNINDNDCLYCYIIIHKLDTFIDVMVF